MQVFKVEKPILAFVLVVTDDGNNFKELSKEVKEVGGSAELIHDGLARIVVNGRTYDLPIGYALVLDGGGRLLSKQQFDTEYASADVDGFALDDLLARLNKVETQISKLKPAGAKASVVTKADVETEAKDGTDKK